MQVETFFTKRIKKSPYECTVFFLKKIYFCALSYMGLNFIKKVHFCALSYMCLYYLQQLSLATATLSLNSSSKMPQVRTLRTARTSQRCWKMLSRQRKVKQVQVSLEVRQVTHQYRLKEEQMPLPRKLQQIQTPLTHNQVQVSIPLRPQPKPPPKIPVRPPPRTLRRTLHQTLLSM